MKEVLMIHGIYEGSRDLQDKSKKLTIHTQEVTPKTAAELQKCVQQYCYIAIKMEPFLKEELDIISTLKTDFDDPGKTPGQRLRATLYRYWQQNNEGYSDFNLFYNYRMEGIINYFKSKLI